MMLSSLLRLASSASTPFLYSFFLGTPAAGFMVQERRVQKQTRINHCSLVQTHEEAAAAALCQSLVLEHTSEAR